MPSLLDLSQIVRPETSCAGIGQDFGSIGAGNRAGRLAGLNMSLANSRIP
jgi:hypothetical protein